MDHATREVVRLKQIETLVDDIYAILSKGISKDDVTEEVEQKVKTFGDNLSKTILDALVDRDRPATLRMSNIGKPCLRQLWYEINQPDKKEPLSPDTYMKFLIGHLCEELLLFMADLAGHSVEGRQDEQDVAGVKGHRDVVLDGVTTDAKSASKYSFEKFRSGKLKEDDAFGYILQLQGYLEAGQTDPVVTDKDRAAFAVIAKESGKITLDIHDRQTEPTVLELYEFRKEVANRAEPPERGFEPIPHATSGNEKLSLNCSYCPFKRECFPNLRTFISSQGPIYFTRIVKQPNMVEIVNENSSSTKID